MADNTAFPANGKQRTLGQLHGWLEWVMCTLDADEASPVMVHIDGHLRRATGLTITLNDADDEAVVTIHGTEEGDD